MIVGIMQPYFFPYIGYWQLIHTVDQYVIYDDTYFRKGGWIHRNRILIHNEPRMINVQMRYVSQNKRINEIELYDDKTYIKDLVKTILFSYKKAPFFDEVFPVIEDIVFHKETNLARYLEYSIRRICDYLSIDTEIVVSSSIQKNNTLKRPFNIIHMCKLLGADNYYNAIGGQELYSFDDFRKEGINLKFLKTTQVPYKQFNKEFIPNLSIIDLIMFNSKKEMTEMLEKYVLI